MIKIVNIEEQINPYLLIDLKLSGKAWLMIILKVTQKDRALPSFCKIHFSKYHRGGGDLNPQPFKG